MQKQSKMVWPGMTQLRGQNPGRAGRVTGHVAIVGAGPGDPELLTLKALRHLQTADIVFFDNLVSPEIMALVSRRAKRVSVGKSKGNHSVSQADINALMAARAAEGLHVVRLKGGDPFIFGRGGEERAYLRARGIAVDIVPGITAASGCASAAGIPLTERGVAQAVTFLTGHARNGEPDLDWRALARGGQTLAVYMAVSTAGRVAQRLIENGLAGGTPLAVIENGSLPGQRVLVGHLAGLRQMIDSHSVTGPALILIGEVVRSVEPGVLENLAEAV